MAVRVGVLEGKRERGDGEPEVRVKTGRYIGKRGAVGGAVYGRSMEPDGYTDTAAGPGGRGFVGDGWPTELITF